MKFQRNINRLVIVVMLLLVTMFVCVLSRPQPPPPVRLTFLHFTNGVTGGVLPVFALVNQSSESVTCEAGHYQGAARAAIELRKGDCLKRYVRRAASNAIHQIALSK